MHQKIGTAEQQELFRAKDALPGSMECDLSLRLITSQAIKNGSKSRAQIADEMTNLLGVRVTEQMLNCFTAESKDKHRFPAAFVPALCHITGDVRLLQALAQKLGLMIVGSEEMRLLELGRAVEVERSAALRREQLLSGGSR